MPAGDGTGPGGFGPMTGRAAGYCAGFGVPGFANPMGGRGFARFGRGFGGRGGARGWRNRFPAGAPASDPYAAGPFYGGAAGPGVPPGAATDELEMLSQQAGYFEKALEEIRSRIGDLEKEAGESK